MVPIFKTRIALCIIVACKILRCAIPQFPLAWYIGMLGNENGEFVRDYDAFIRPEGISQTGATLIAITIAAALLGGWCRP